MILRADSEDIQAAAAFAVLHESIIGSATHLSHSNCLVEQLGLKAGSTPDRTRAIRTARLAVLLSLAPVAKMYSTAVTGL